MILEMIKGSMIRSKAQYIDQGKPSQIIVAAILER